MISTHWDLLQGNTEPSPSSHCLTFRRSHYQAKFGLPQWFSFVCFHSISFAIIFIRCLMNYAEPVPLQRLGKRICWLFQRVNAVLWLFSTVRNSCIISCVHPDLFLLQGKMGKAETSDDGAVLCYLRLASVCSSLPKFSFS